MTSTRATDFSCGQRTTGQHAATIDHLGAVAHVCTDPARHLPPATENKAAPTGISVGEEGRRLAARRAEQTDAEQAREERRRATRDAMEAHRDWLRRRLAGTLRRGDVLEHILHAVALTHEGRERQATSYARWLAGDPGDLGAYAQRSKETALAAAAAVVLDDGASAAEQALRSGRPLGDLAVHHYRWMLAGGYTPAPIEAAAIDAAETADGR